MAVPRSSLAGRVASPAWGWLRCWALLALWAVLAAEACYVTNVGRQTCSTTKCSYLSGGYINTSVAHIWLPGDNQKYGGLSYEYFYSLSAGGWYNYSAAVPAYEFIGQVAASDVSKCCRTCASTALCQFFRYFPQGTTDLFQSITNPQGKYAFTYPPPFPPCSVGKCVGYNATDGSKPCMLFKLNTVNYYYLNGTACVGPPFPAGCYPGVGAGTGAKIVGPAAYTSSSYVDPDNGTIITGAFTGRPRSYWGGSCNPYTNGSVTDDPHFVGGDGVRFDFNGDLGHSFCLVSDKSIHINMQLSGYYDDRTYGASIVKDGKALRTWITGLSFLWRDDSGTAHQLYLGARKGKQQERGDGFIANASLDNSPVTIPKQEGGHFEAAGMSLSLAAQTMKGPFDMDEFSLKIGDVLSATIRLRVAHPLLQTASEAYAHFNLQLNEFKPTPSVHGVLGQTLRSDSGRLMKVLEYKVLTSLLRAPIQADGETGSGYLEGNTADYITSSIAVPDCKFAVYQA